MHIIDPYRYGGDGGPSSILLDNLVAWWDMSETSGVRYDSHNSYDLSDAGSVGYDTGLSGNAASFADSTNRLYNTNAVWSATSLWSLAAWIYVPAALVHNSQSALMGASATNSGWSGYFDGFDDISVYYRQSATYTNADVWTGTAVTPEAWHCMIFRGRTTRQIDLYLNDVSAGIEQSTVIWDNTNTRTLEFGYQSIAGYLPSEGTLISNACFYNALMTTDQMTEYYNSGTPLKYSDL
jgi:hypothetical protein